LLLRSNLIAVGSRPDEKFFFATLRSLGKSSGSGIPSWEQPKNSGKTPFETGLRDLEKAFQRWADARGSMLKKNSMNSGGG